MIQFAIKIYFSLSTNPLVQFLSLLLANYTQWFPKVSEWKRGDSNRVSFSIIKYILMQHTRGGGLVVVTEGIIVIVGRDSLKFVSHSN